MTHECTAGTRKGEGSKLIAALGPAAALAVSALLSACGTDGLRVEFFRDIGYEFSWSERRTITNIARDSVREVRPLLPGVPAELVLKVRPWKNVIPETGDGGTWSPPNVIYYQIDPAHGSGPAATATHGLRATIFHELHHLVRRIRIPRSTLVEAAVAEGLATAFERDAGGATVPWGQYPDNVDEWTLEMMALPPGADRKTWMSQHPDGRRWIGKKVGTYLADCALQASGRSAAELVARPANDIVALAEQACPALKR